MASLIARVTRWIGADLDDDFLQPVFNIVNKATTFFVAYIASSDVALRYRNPVGIEDDLSDKVLNASWEEFKERVKFSKKYRQALKDGTITGDYVAHLIFTDEKPYGGAFSDIIGQIDMDLVDATNYYVADTTSKNFQKQKYVQIDGRSFVSTLEEEREDSTTILSDEDTETQIGMYGDLEIEPILSDDGLPEGLATWVLTYTKKRETRTIKIFDYKGEPELDEQGNQIEKEVEDDWVYSSKCTANGYIYKDRPVGFNMYPIIPGNWIEQKNTFHGQSFVKNMIPAQIFINQGFAMAMKHTMDTAFSKFFYDVDAMDGISADVSTQVGLRLKAGQSIRDVGEFKAPGNMSDKVISMIDLAYSYIKDVIGLGDSLTGNVNPEQASGVSIVSSAKQAGIPIEVPKMNSYDWVEDIGKVFKNMVQNLYGERPVLLEEEGRTFVGTYDFEKLKSMYKPPVIEVGESSYWSEDNFIAILDNMLQAEMIDYIFYLEQMPEGKVPGKEELIRKLKEKAEQQAQQPVQEPVNPEQLQGIV